MNHILIEDAIAVPDILNDLLILNGFEKYLHLLVIAWESVITLFFQHCIGEHYHEEVIAPCHQAEECLAKFEGPYLKVEDWFFEGRVDDLRIDLVLEECVVWEDKQEADVNEDLALKVVQHPIRHKMNTDHY